MSDYAVIRIETTAGVVVAYLATDAHVEAPNQNDVLGTPRPGQRAAIARDRSLWVGEVQVQCQILGTGEGLQADHKAALLALFGAGSVSAEDQLRRIHHYAQGEGGTFRLYVRGRAYTATTDGAVNYLSGVFPAVIFKDIKESLKPGVDRIGLFLSFTVGIPRP